MRLCSLTLSARVRYNLTKISLNIVQLQMRPSDVKRTCRCMLDSRHGDSFINGGSWFVGGSWRDSADAQDSGFCASPSCLWSCNDCGWLAISRCDQFQDGTSRQRSLCLRKTSTNQNSLLILGNSQEMFSEQQISISEWFLKNHVTLKTEVMMLKIQLCHYRNKLQVQMTIRYLF